MRTPTRASPVFRGTFQCSVKQPRSCARPFFDFQATVARHVKCVAGESKAGFVPSTVKPLLGRERWNRCIAVFQLGKLSVCSESKPVLLLGLQPTFSGGETRQNTQRSQMKLSISVTSQDPSQTSSQTKTPTRKWAFTVSVLGCFIGCGGKI